LLLAITEAQMPTGEFSPESLQKEFYRARTIAEVKM
jgi:hypothetical protein